MTMWEDPIVEEVRKVREEHAARFDYDLDAIYKDLKRLERESGREMVNLKPRLVQEIRDSSTLKHAAVVPGNEQGLREPEMQERLARAEEWVRNHPARETDLEKLESSLGITS
ncbi:MAG: hypothetical protein H7833_20255 [Magnetococcus sp. DMHC-1]|nr:hypothetical protein [Magnetococcales bacterium]